MKRRAAAFKTTYNGFMSIIYSSGYGSDFDATRYLDRFFDFQFTLPPADMSRFNGKIGLDEDAGNKYSKMRNAVVDTFFRGLRDTGKYCRTMDIIHKNAVFSRHYLGDPESQGFCLSLYILVPILVGLKMTDAFLCSEFLNGRNPQPLFDVIKHVERSDWFLRDLLSPNETFDDENVTDSIHKVTVETKLKQFYDAVFNGSDLDFRNIVGGCSFRHTVKRDIFDVASMISEFARYDN